MTDEIRNQMIEKILKANTEDDAVFLFEDIFEAGRQDMLKDLKIDLTDWDQTEAVEYIEANY